MNKLKHCELTWCLKATTGRRKTSWLHTKRRKRDELGKTEKKSSEKQCGGLEPETTGLHVQRPNHSATLPLNEI